MTGRVILIGRLVAAPQLRTLADGGHMVEIRVVTVRGTDPTVTEEYDVIAFGQVAVSLSRMPGGRLVYVEGRWQAREGADPQVVADQATRIGLPPAAGRNTN